LELLLRRLDSSRTLLLRRCALSSKLLACLSRVFFGVVVVVDVVGVVRVLVGVLFLDFPSGDSDLSAVFLEEYDVVRRDEDRGDLFRCEEEEEE